MMTRLLRCLRGCASACFVLLAACGRDQPLPGVGAAPASAPVSAQASPSGATGDAHQCYDLTPAKGKTVSLSITDTTYALSGSPSASAERTEEYVTGEMVQFEGQTATETRTTGSYSSAASKETYRGSEYSLQTGPAELTYYGNVANNTGQARGVSSTVQTRMVLTPPLVDQTASLKVGQSLRKTFTSMTTLTVNGVARRPIPFTQDQTVRFVGFERLTIPAGTFNTCRFELIEHTGGSAMQWVLVGHGTQLRFVNAADSASGGSVSEVTAIRINGKMPG